MLKNKVKSCQNDSAIFKDFLKRQDRFDALSEKKLLLHRRKKIRTQNFGNVE